MINSDIFATTTDRYQYSGKEFDRMNGLDLYYFHAANTTRCSADLPRPTGGINVNGNSWLPSSIFNDIIDQNPHGKYLKTQP